MQLKLLKTLVGPGDSDSLPKQGWARGKELILEEWRKPSYGIVRVTRLFLITIGFLFPTVHIDQFTRSTRPAVVACWRELYYLGRAVFLLATLLTPLHRSQVAVGLAIYFTLDILFHLAGGALVWGRYSIHPQRSLLLALINYGEITVAFAVFYVHCNCLTCSNPSATQALYFSLVTATTVGFGDVLPVGLAGQRIVIAQLTVFVVFVLLFVSTFVSRVQPEVRTREGA